MEITIDDIKNAFVGANSIDYNSIYEKAFLPVNKIVEKPEPCLSVRSGYTNVDICTLKNLSILKGKAKSKKTFAGTMFVSAFFTYGVHSKIYGNIEDTRDIVIFDTEQSEYHVSLVANRIKKLAEFTQQPNKLKIFCLRPYNPEERKMFINRYFELNDVCFAYIDGARDLLYDINSQRESTELVSDMMRWSHDNNCHIMTVIHENKAEKSARGHIGSELTNKAETVISIEKEDKKYSTVKPELCRGLEFEPFSFYIENGLPIIDTEFISNDYSDERPF